ncbi:hypothetical protein [Streptomyces sp. NPDC092307]|uniref:hypothetical protein n=1 Tax=Streptomyces sp. NPDC092307 TaxID=3366013 RepID=UPI00382746B1
MTIKSPPFEFPFLLPHGYVDADGVCHRSGAMRMATARDELAPLVDLRVRENPHYLGVLLLSLVITRLGKQTEIRPETVESLFAGDLAYLQEMYERINSPSFAPDSVCTTCGSVPQADEVWTGDRLGESVPTR